MDVEHDYPDHSKLIKKIEATADKICVDIKAYLYNHATSGVVREKYIITDNLKESTFSYVYLVGS